MACKSNISKLLILSKSATFLFVFLVTMFDIKAGSVATAALHIPPGFNISALHIPPGFNISALNIPPGFGSK